MIDIVLESTIYIDIVIKSQGVVVFHIIHIQNESINKYIVYVSPIKTKSKKPES